MDNSNIRHRTSAIPRKCKLPSQNNCLGNYKRLLLLWYLLHKPCHSNNILLDMLLWYLCLTAENLNTRHCTNTSRMKHMLLNQNNCLEMYRLWWLLCQTDILELWQYLLLLQTWSLRYRSKFVFQKSLCTSDGNRCPKEMLATDCSLMLRLL